VPKGEKDRKERKTENEVIPPTAIQSQKAGRTKDNRERAILLKLFDRVLMIPEAITSQVLLDFLKSRAKDIPYFKMSSSLFLQKSNPVSKEEMEYFLLKLILHGSCGIMTASEKNKEKTAEFLIRLKDLLGESTPHLELESEDDNGIIYFAKYGVARNDEERNFGYRLYKAPETRIVENNFDWPVADISKFFITAEIDRRSV
jgi:hypothetical protein